MTRAEAISILSTELKYTAIDVDYAHDTTDGKVELVPGQDIANALTIAITALRHTYGIDNDPEIVTNADRIRAMNDEELAAFLCDRCEYCTIRRCPAAGMCEHGKGKANGLVTWLRQPAEEVQIHG